MTANIADTYPKLEEEGILDVLFPKKEPVIVLKCPGPKQLQVVVIQGEPRFFCCEGDYYPTLRILCQYPHIMPRLRIDRGAIKYVLSGAQIMCPGLNSPAAVLHDELEEGEPVAIFAEGKENPLAIGCMLLSTAEIRKTEKGPGVENLHCLNDGLWKTPLIDA